MVSKHLRTKETCDLADMNDPRHGHVILEREKQLYVIGGFNESGALSSCERYTISTDSWEKLPPMPVGIGNCIAVVWRDSIYVMNKTNDFPNKVFVFSIADSSWLETDTHFESGFQVLAFGISEGGVMHM